jgi:hypothetical protein
MIQTLPQDNRAKIQALHSVARYQAMIPGKTLAAEATAMQARVLAESTTGPCDQAVISAEVAAMMSNLGHSKAAREAYQRSNQGLSGVESRRELLVCLGQMVGSYLRAGDRGGATVLLQDMTKGLRMLESRSDRDLLTRRISFLYQKLGDIQTAQELAREISKPELRESTLYENVLEESSAGQIGTAMQGSEAIQSPFFKARAKAILGLVQGWEETYQNLADESFRQAQLLADSLNDPMEQMVISAELARYATHAGRTSEADAGFANAIRLLGQMPDTLDLDQPIAILAVNQGRALRLRHARQQLSKIGDAAIAKTTSEIISESELLAGEMVAVTP